MWAYPDGIKIYDHNLTVINDHEPENSFGKDHILNLSSSEKKSQPSDYFYSFVHTDYSLNRTYFTAICWHVHLSGDRKKGIFIWRRKQKRIKVLTSTQTA